MMGRRNKSVHLPIRSFRIIFLLLRPRFDRFRQLRSLLKLREGRRRPHLLLLLPRLRSPKVLIIHGVTSVLGRREGRVLRVDLPTPLLNGLTSLLMLMIVDRRRVGLVAKSLLFVVRRRHGSRR